MKWWQIVLGLGLMAGVLVGVFSLYQLSVDSTLKKLGLIGADLAATVEEAQVTDWRAKVESNLRCGIANRIRGTMEFMLSGDSEQGQLSFRLGEHRIKCGASMISEGQVEVGTYEVLKGLGYLKEGYKFVGERGSVDLRVCEELPGREVSEVMSELLSNTTGRVHELLYEDYGEVLLLEKPVWETCIDERNSRR